LRGYQSYVKKALLPGGGVYLHVVQPLLDAKIHKERWDEETNLFQLGKDYGVELTVNVVQISKIIFFKIYLPYLLTFFLKEFGVTAVERNKTAAKTAAYMAIYKKLFNARKVDAFQFIKSTTSSPDRIVTSVVNGNLNIRLVNKQPITAGKCLFLPYNYSL
jgi:hypothetical protein